MNKRADAKDFKEGEPVADTPDCFVLMPISEVDGYEPNHFKHVYQNLIKPACEQAGYNPVRADDVKASNFIHLDILKKIVETPIAICDLSTRNPNVLFELGIRQAFDLPVVLIQEIGTPKIFDIGPLRCLDYSKDMRYHDVLASQAILVETIKETVANAGELGNVNSIVKLLSLNNAAKIPDVSQNKDSMTIDLMRSEFQQMRRMFEGAVARQTEASAIHSPVMAEMHRLSAVLDKLKSARPGEASIKLQQVNDILEELYRYLKSTVSKHEFNAIKFTIDRAEAIQKKLVDDLDDIPF